ncbi:hypothetical protein AYO44_05225 [Planctomycetaceae bacterium SCGC AG-212-F19]|nr:hypothetical protein AYO44_05225 [Planctomycetaceae bacterium SCGC AG-212-F19]
MFDPYHLWLSIPPGQRPPTHYQLLGVSPEEQNATVIREAALRQTNHLRTYQSGPNAQTCAKLLNEVAHAQIVLIDPIKRKAYDATLANAAPKNPPKPPPKPPPAAATAGKTAPAAVATAARNASAAATAPAKTAPAAATAPAKTAPATATTAAKTAPAVRKNHAPAKKGSGGRLLVVALLVLIVLGAGGWAAWHFGALPGGFASVRPTAANTPPESAPPTSPVAPPTTRRPDPTIKATDPGEVRPPPKPDPEDPKINPTTDPNTKPDPRGAAKPATIAAAAPAGESKPTVLAKDSRPAELRAARAKAAKPPVPDDTALAAEEKVIRELFKADYAKKTPADMQALAEKLLKQALETKDSPTSRYALLREANRIATLALDAPSAVKAVDEMARDFAFPVLESKVTTLDTLTKRVTPATAKKSQIDTVLDVVDEALAEHQYEPADRLIKLAESVARIGKNAALTTAVNARAREVEALHKDHEDYQKALAVLAKNPADPAANLNAGKHLCLAKSDWEQGLVRLAQGSDAKLQDLARKDLATPADAAAKAELGDTWWELAEGEKGPGKPALQARAVLWYDAALPALTGLTKAKVEKRLAGLPTKPVLGKMIAFANVKDLAELGESKYANEWTIKDGKLTGGKFSVFWFKQPLADPFWARIAFTSGAGHLGIAFGPEAVYEPGEFWMVEVSPAGKLRLKLHGGAVLGAKDGVSIPPGPHVLSIACADENLTVFVDGQEKLRYHLEQELPPPARMGLFSSGGDLTIETVTSGAAATGISRTRPSGTFRPDATGVLELFDENKDFVELLSKGGRAGGKVSLETKDRYSGSMSLRITRDAGELNCWVSPPTWNFKIVEKPTNPEEYRYITFAWKKVGGKGIMLQVFGKPAKVGEAVGAYTGGVTAFDQARQSQIVSQFPATWVVVTRDLYKDFGQFTLTGLGFTPHDGEAGYFDAIYLARTPDALKYIKK